MLMQDENLTRAILAVINTQPGIRLAILFGSLAGGWGAAIWTWQ